MLINTGVPTAEDLAAVTPDEERFAKGPAAIVECFQKIPCNPCVEACPFGAIIPLKDINDLPKVDFEKCTGCGLCIAQCPGLAIFVVDKTSGKNNDKTRKEDQALVALPYEFLPVPRQGQWACGLNRAGEEKGWFEVAKVTSGGEKNKTSVIWLAVPKELVMEIRCIRAGGFKDDG